MEEKIYTVEEIAEMLQVGDHTVRRWLRDGQLKGFKMGGRVWRVKESELIRFINENNIRRDKSDMKRIVVEIYDKEERLIKKAFMGKWLVEDMETEEEGHSYGWRWNVAETEKGYIAVYAFKGDSPHDCFLTSFEVYDSLEDAEGTLPDDVLSAAAEELGKEYIVELDL